MSFLVYQLEGKVTLVTGAGGKGGLAELPL
jgi:hypothetical protein